MTNEFSNRLKILMQYRGYTQTALAKKLNMSLTTLNSYTTGARNPSSETYNLLCSALDCSTEYLYNLPFSTPKTIAPYIRKYMDDISKQTSIHPQIINGWLNNQVNITDDDVNKILSAVPVEIIEGDGSFRSAVIINKITQWLPLLTRDELNELNNYLQFIISKRKSK